MTQIEGLPACLFSIPGRSRFQRPSRQGYRFVEAPKMTPLHERGASAHDISGRIDVGVGAMTTGDALEDRLALAAPGVNDTTFGARLGRVGGGNINQPPAGSLQFVVQLAFEEAPALSENGAVQAGLLADAAPRLSDGAPSARRHAFDVQVLKGDHAEPADDAGAGHMQSMGTHTGDLGGCSGHDFSLGSVAPRSPLSPGEDALSAPLPLLKRADVGEVDVLAGRKAEGVRHAPVDTDSRKIISGLRRSPDIASEDDVPSVAGPRDGGRAQHALDVTRHSEPDPANTGKADLAPLGVEAADLQIRPTVSGRVILAKPAASGKPAPSEEGLKRLVEVFERRFLHHAGHGGDPVELGPQIGEFAALACEADAFAFGVSVLPPEVSSLFERNIVDEAHDSDPMTEGFGLIWGRDQLVFEAAMHAASVAQNALSQQEGAIS